jgi:hypothetical protein
VAALHEPPRVGCVRGDVGHLGHAVPVHQDRGGRRRVAIFVSWERTLIAAAILLAPRLSYASRRRDRT